MFQLRRYIFLFLLLAGCATKTDRTFTDQVSEDLVETFDLSDKKFEKFKVAEELPAQKEAVGSEVTKVPKVVQKTKPAKKFAPKPKPKPKPKSKPEPKLKPKPQVETVVRKKAGYPEGYPEEFKKYDRRSKEFWYKFKPKIFPGEEFTFEVSYLGVTAGHVKMQTMSPVKVGDQVAYQFKAHMKSARYYQMIYKLDDSLESIVEAEHFIPIKYTLVQRESVQSVDDLQLFDWDELKTYYWYKRIKRGQLKKDERIKHIPRYFQDSYSPLYFVRGFPLNIGDVYEFPIVTRAKIWLLKIKVEKIEEIKVMGKWVKAFRLNAATRFPGVLKKRGDIIFWYSADKLRKLLKFEAKVKIGSVTGELVDYKKGGEIGGLQGSINLFYICLSDQWGTRERNALRDCRLAIEEGHRVYLYCYRDSTLDLKSKELGVATLYHQGKAATKFFKWYRLGHIPKLLKIHSIDLVHCHDFKMIWPMAWFLRRSTLIPLVLTHGNELKKFYRRLWYRPLAARIDLVFLSGLESSLNISAHLGIPARRIEFQGMGMERLKFFRKENPIDHAENEILIGSNIGGDEDDSTFLVDLLNAVKVIHQKGEIAIRLVLVSERTWSTCLIYEEIKSLLWERSLGEVVVFEDQNPVEHVQKFVHLWCSLPRQEDLEDFAISAAMNGTPVLFPRTPISMELVRELGHIGETYKKHDARELRAKIEYIVSELEDYQKTVKRKASTIEERYGIESYKKQLFANYHKVLERRRRLHARRAGRGAHKDGVSS